jgi:putative ABC transport system permease protein
MFFRLLSRSLQVRRGRVALGILSVAMGTSVAVAFAGVSLVLGDRLARSLRAYGANIVLLPEGGSMAVELAGTDYRPPLRTGAIADTSLHRIHETFWRNNILGYAPELAAVSQVTPWVGRMGDLPSIRAGLIGTWFRRDVPLRDGHTFAAGITTVAPWWKVDGRYPREPEGSELECVVGKRLADVEGIRVGQLVGIQPQLSDSSKDLRWLRVVGILETGGIEEESIYMPLDALQSWLARPHQVDWVLVSALIKPGFPPAPDASRDPKAFERWSCTPYVTSVAYELDRSLPGVEARPARQMVEAEGQIVHRLNLLMLLLSLAALVGASLGVMSTMTASVVERTTEIALARSLGATRGAILRFLVSEALVLALAGGLIGALLGIGLAQIAGRAAFGVNVPFHPLVLPLGLIVACAVAAAGSWAPFRRAVSLSPAEALKP